MPPLYLNAILLFAALVTCLALLSAYLVYALCRRRRPRHRSVEVRDVSLDPVVYSPSKERLYSFCWKKQLVRVEPAGPTPNLTQQEEVAKVAEEEEDVVAEWQALHGGPRLLYTIKEEEREGENSVEVESAKNFRGKMLRLADVLAVSVVSEVVEQEEEQSCGDDDLSEEATPPFEMPTESPLYYNPSPSPFPSPGKNVVGLRLPGHGVSGGDHGRVAPVSSNSTG